MSAVVSTRCHRCGAELRDRTSRMFGIGPECRKSMRDTEAWHTTHDQPEQTMLETA